MQIRESTSHLYNASPLRLHLALLLLGAGSRMIVYLQLPRLEQVALDANMSRYFGALLHHFKDYLDFTTLKPPLSYIIHAGVLRVLGTEVAIQFRAMLLIVFFLDVTAIALIMSAAFRLGASRAIAFGVCLVFSVALVPFELWRQGTHYDHHTFFFTSFLLWAVVKTLTSSRQLWVFVSSTAGSLLVAQSTVNSFVVGILILAAIFVRSTQLHIRWYAPRVLALGLLAPSLVLGGLLWKNSRHAGVLATSNLGGAAAMTVVQSAYLNSSQVRSAIVRSGVSAWYLWCYDNVTPPRDASGAPLKGWVDLARAFGICFEPASVHDLSWPFHFSSLLQRLHAEGPQDLTEVVAADSADAVDRQYRFAGFAPELSPRWIGIYGRASMKVFFFALFDNTKGMARAFGVNQLRFAVKGPLFPYHTLGQLRNLSTDAPLSYLFIAFSLLFAFLAGVSYFGAIIMLCVSSFVGFSKFGAILFGQRWGLRGSKLRSSSAELLVFTIPVALLALMFSTLVGVENDRYFMQLTPYLALIACCIHAPPVQH